LQSGPLLLDLVFVTEAFGVNAAEVQRARRELGVVHRGVFDVVVVVVGIILRDEFLLFLVA
jgi:hypothetical protein